MAPGLVSYPEKSYNSTTLEEFPSRKATTSLFHLSVITTIPIITKTLCNLGLKGGRTNAKRILPFLWLALAEDLEIVLGNIWPILKAK